MEKKHLDDVKRLHRFTKCDGKQVFDSASLKDIEVMLRAAAAGPGRDDMVALVASWPSSGQDAEEQEEEEVEEEVLGCVTGQIEGDIIVLLTLVVRGDQRRVGVGELLLGSFKELAIGKKRIETDVSSANDPALRFFARQGFLSNKQGSTSSSSTVELYLDL